MQHARFHPCWALVALAGLFMLAGCDNTIEPFAEDTGLFSVYGYLSLSNDQHFIRIKDLNDPVTEDASTRELDATVTLEHLATGTTETLTDSIVTFDGVYTHNFRADQEIEPGDTYRLTVERSNGRGVQTTATMPELTEVEIIPGDVVEECTRNILFYFRNVPEQRLIHVTVGIAWNNDTHWIDLEGPSTDPPGDPISDFTPSTLIATVVPEPILEHIHDNGGDEADYCTLLDGNEIPVVYTHFGPDWPADSLRTDPLESDIENGLGVFGGLHRDTLSITIDD